MRLGFLKSGFQTYPGRVGRLAILLTLSMSHLLLAGQPELTGRWGDTCLPTQLINRDPDSRTQGLVVVTFSTRCPLARRLVPVLNELQQKHRSDGIQFIALFPNPSDDLREIAEYATDTNLSLPVFRDDPAAPWYAQLEMKMTPEVVVLDTRETLDPENVIYRGQVNGRWFGGGGGNANQEYLDQALTSFLAGKPVELAETAASGCEIETPRATTDARFQDVTFYKDIAPLIQDSCRECHRDGEAGAELFAEFASYDDVASMSGVMLSRMENRLMPPWHGTLPEDSEVGGFKNDTRLHDDQIEMFRAWVDAGCPPGEPADAPEKRTWTASEEWKIGKPDLVFAMPEPYVVPKYRLDEYQFYRIPANFEEDRYIKAIECRPGNKAIVHHIGAIVGPSSQQDLNATSAMMKLYGLTGDQVKKIADYVAGDPFNARVYPEGYALKLPAGHDIFFEMHYTPTGREEQPDVSQLALIWADEPPPHVIETRVFNRKDIRLAPNDQHYEKESIYQFPTDVLIHALGPHMHYRGKDFVLYKVENPGAPDEKRTRVITVAAYDFNWQRTYEFEKPLKLKAGDVLVSVAHFDNSYLNPNNPDPKAAVRFGLKSEQEMLNMRVKYEVVDFGDEDSVVAADGR